MSRSKKPAWWIDLISRQQNHRRRSSKPSISSKLALESLEERTLLAFSAVVDTIGKLTILSDQDVDIVVTSSPVEPFTTQVNGVNVMRTNGQLVPAGQITSIQITDGDFANVINLGGVTKAAFPGITSTISISTNGGNDSITGSEWTDSIVAGVGDDTINTVLGNDTVFTGDGNDLVNIVRGHHWIDLGAGDDRVVPNRPDGGEGDDTIYGNTGDDTIDGGEGVDRVFGGDGNDSLLAGGNGTTLGGGNAHSILFGQDGNDIISSRGGGRSILIGGNGSDRIESRDGADILVDASLVAEADLNNLFDKIAPEWSGRRTFNPTNFKNSFDSPPVDVAIRRLLGILTTGNNAPVFVTPEGIIEDNAPDTLIASTGNDWLLRGVSGTTIQGNDYGVWVDRTRNNVNPSRDDIVVPINSTTTTITARQLLLNDIDGDPDSLRIEDVQLSSTVTSSATFVPTFRPDSNGLASIEITWGALNDPMELFYTLSVFSSTLDNRPGISVRRATTLTSTHQGDFNGDGMLDALRVRDGAIEIATFQQPAFRTWAPLDTQVVWLNPLIGDFSGDGRDDLLMRHGFDRSWYLWTSTIGDSATQSYWAPWTRSNAWSDPLVGDFDADGKDDLFSFRQENADLVIARSTGRGFSETIWNNIRERIGQAYGTLPTEIAFDIGQLNGWGGDDVLVHDPRTDGKWAFVLADGYRFTNLSVPVSFPGWNGTYYVGNFDSDRSDEILAWNASGQGQWESAEVLGNTIAMRGGMGSNHPNRNDFIVRDIDWDGDEDLITKPAGATSPRWRVLRTDANGVTLADSSSWDQWLDAATFVADGKLIAGEVNPIVNLRIDTASPSNRPVLLGDIPAGFDVSAVTVEFDTDGDGTADGWARPDNVNRSFTFRPYGLATGPQSIRARIAVSPPDRATSVSLWSTPLSFITTPTASTLPIPRLVGLADDIGGRTGDSVANDRKGRAAEIVYQLQATAGLDFASVRIEFDHDGDGRPDGSAPATTSLSNYLAVGLGTGTHQVRARTRELATGGRVSEWSAPLTFSVSANLNVIYRDFPFPGQIPAGMLRHPHFESNISQGWYEQMVQPTLGSDGKPMYKPLAVQAGTTQSSTNPLDFEPDLINGVAPLLGPSSPRFPLTPKQYFDLWYNTNTTYNQEITGQLWFEETILGSSAFSYASDSFFPLDTQGFGKQGQNQNFLFTMQIQGSFTYRSGQSLKSNGSDDDLWIFVNNQLVVDIGGIHGAQESTSSIQSLSLVDGKTYPIDLFFAERHTSASNFKVTLNLSDLRAPTVSEPIMVEQARFLTDSPFVGQNLAIDFSASNPTQAISFEIDSLIFNKTDPFSINDAFEIMLVDEQGKSAVPTIGFDKQAFINWTEDEAPRLARGVAFVPGSGGSQGRIYLDTRQISAGSRLRLVARLINNDGLTGNGPDETTQARFKPSTLVRHTTLPPNVTFQGTQPVLGELRPSSGTIALNDLGSVRSAFVVEYGHTTFDSRQDRLVAEIELTPTGSRSVRGDYPALLVLRSISDPSVRLANPHGYTAEGDPYYDITSLVFESNKDDWKTGDIPVTAELAFINPERKRFTYALDILGRFNQAPTVLPIEEVIEWRPTALAQEFRYTLNARDPESDSITWEWLAQPSGMTLDVTRGELRWSTVPDQGDYVVRVLARDVRGAASIPASFVLRVLPPANRPPRFTTIPEESARAGRTFIYLPSAVDPDGDPVTLQSIQHPPGAVFDPVLKQIRWTPSSSQIGQAFPMELRASDGRGGTETQRSSLRVVADPANGPPVIISQPAPHHVVATSSTGQSLGTVSPTSISLNLAAGERSPAQSVNVTLQTGIVNSADVVFIIDRSPSMSFRHDWLIGNPNQNVPVGMIEQVDRKLGERQITGNRYGFILYGANIQQVGPANNPWLVDSQDNNNYIDTTEVRSFLPLNSNGSLSLEGTNSGPDTDLTENVYAAIRTALDRTDYRPGVGINFILVTDEDADDFNAGGGQAELLARLIDKNVTLSAISANELQSNDSQGNTAGFAPTVPSQWELKEDYWEGRPTPGDEAALFSTWNNPSSVSLSAESGGMAYEQGFAFDLRFSAARLNDQSPGRARLYFSYRDAQNYRFIEADYATSAWRVGWRAGSSAEVSYELSQPWLPPVEVDRVYRLSVIRLNIGSNQFDYLGIDGRYIESHFQALFPSGGMQPSLNHHVGKTGITMTGSALRVYDVHSGWEDVSRVSPGVRRLSVWRQEFGTKGSRPADGIAPNGMAFFANANGTTSFGTEGRPIPDDSFPANLLRSSAVAHYWPLVQATGGTMWNINSIGGAFGRPIQGNFSATFADQQPKTIFESTRPELVATDPSAIARIEVLPAVSPTDNTARYQVEFVGDGRSKNLSLQFVTRFSYQSGQRVPNLQTGLVGQIPVRINAPYEYQLRAIDPDGDRPLRFRWTKANVDRFGATLTEDGLFVWKPEENGIAPGSSRTFSVTVEDGFGGSDTQEWTVQLLPASTNAAPTFVVPTPATGNGRVPLPAGSEEAQYEFTFRAVDPNNDRIRYSLLGIPPEGMTIDQESGKLYWRPEVAGNYTIDVVADDPRGGQTLLAASLTIGPRTSGNLPPTLTSIDLFPLAVAGEVYRGKVSANDPNQDAVRYVLSTGPRGLVVDADSGVVAWKPSATQVGRHDGVILVQDSRGQSSPVSFRIDVQSVNTPPSFDSVPRSRVEPARTLIIPLMLRDPNGDRLSYVIDPADLDRMPTSHRPSIQDASSPTFLWNVHPQQATGTYSFGVWARDGRGGDVKQTIIVEVGSTGVTPNVRPRITLYIPQGRLWEYQVAPALPNTRVSLDDLGKVLAWRVEETTIRWTPQVVGEYPPSVVTVEGEKGAKATQEITLIVVPLASNAAPVMLPTTIEPLAADIPFQWTPTYYSPSGQSIAFSFASTSQHPVGMSIDPSSGRLSWTPSRSAAGKYNVRLQLTSGAASTIADVPIVVLDNAPPTFPMAGSPSWNIRDGRWTMSLSASDPNPGDAAGIEYSLRLGPPGMTIVGQSLQFDASGPGTYSYILQAKDARGGTSIIQRSLVVFDGLLNRAPVVPTRPTTRVPAGTTYRTRLEASDPDDDSLRFEKIEGPGNLFVLPGGVVEWATQASDTSRNTHTYKVRVSDSRNVFTDRVYSVDVLAGYVENVAPEITNEPKKGVLLGETFIFQPKAIDPDFDLLRWSLLLGPQNASFNPETGEIRWTPTGADNSRELFVVQVADPWGGSAERGFAVRVNTSNLPPVRLNDPPSVTYTGQFVSQPMAFDDPEGDTVDITMTPSNSWLTYNSQTRRLEGAAPSPGNFDFTLLASDGVNQLATSFRLEVRPGSRPLPPKIENFSAPLYAVAGGTYVFDTNATDPNNDPLTFIITGQLPNATFVGDELRWPVPANQPTGLASGVIEIRDSTGLSTRMIVNIAVLPSNASPSISSALSSFTRVIGNDLREDLRRFVSDPDEQEGDVPSLSIELIASSSPNLVLPNLSANGVLTWPRLNAVAGNATFRLTAVDRVGVRATREFVISTIPDTEPPIPGISPSQGIVGTINRPVSIWISTEDNVGVAELRVNVTQVEPVGANRVYDLTGGRDSVFSFTPLSTGIYRIIPIAEDPSRNEGRGTPVFVRVIDPAAPAPRIEIASPIGSATLREPTPLVGTIDFPANVENARYRLRLYDQASPEETIWQAEGIGDRINEPFGFTVDPRTIPDGRYCLVIEAEYRGSAINRFERSFSVASESKVGNFSISFADMAAAVAGIPIVVRRTYDSMRIGRDKDFGRGWKLNVDTTSVDVDLATTGSAINAPLPSFKNGTLITVTLPGGKRESFQFEPFAPPGPIQAVFAPRFRAVQGTTSSLRLANELPLYPGAREGEYLVSVAEGVRSFNPADPSIGGSGAYILRTRTGIEYTIDAATGELISQRDRVGNEILYTGTGIVDKATGLGVEWVYDDQGRILSMSGPGNQTRNYSYSPAGDLINVTTQGGSVNSFEYTAPRPGLLTAIKQQNRLVMQPIFDPVTGRVQKIVDADGKEANLDYSLSLSGNRTLERVLDSSSPTQATALNEVIKDARGRIIREIQHLRQNNAGTWTTTGYLITAHEYDIAGNRTASSRPFTLSSSANPIDDGSPVFPSRTTYNSIGRPTRIVDAQGNVTSFDYDQAGNLWRTVDPLGRISTQQIDPNTGLLKETRDAEGRTTRYRYDIAGNLIETIQVRRDNGIEISESLSSIASNAAGQPVSTKNASGLERFFRYDQRQQLVLTYRLATDESITAPAGMLIADRTLFDNEGRETESRHYVVSLANISSSSAIESAIASIMDDSPNRTIERWSTRTVYDTLGRIAQSIDRFGTITQTTYDRRGLAVQSATQTRATADNTPVWMVERTLYDDQGRETFITDSMILADPFAAAVAVAGSLTQYDSLGRVTRVERRTDVRVDLQLQEDATDPLSRTYRTNLTAAGTLITHLGKEWAQETRYDDAGRVDYTIDRSTGLYSKTEYDNLDRTIRTIVHTSTNWNKPAAIVHSTFYDAAGQVSRSVDAAGRSTWFEYDRTGRQTAIVREALLDPETGLLVHPRMETTYNSLGHKESERINLRQRVAGDPSSIVRQHPVTGQVLFAQETSFEYDIAGRTTMIKLPWVGTGIAGTPIYRYQYNSLGNQTLQTGPNQGQTRFHYDFEGRPTGRTLPLGGDTTSNPNDFRETFTYELTSTAANGDRVYGQRVEERDFDGNVTRYLYDNRPGAGGRVKQIDRYMPGTNLAGTPDERVLLSYDSFGRVINSQRLRRQGSNLISDRVELTTYDADGRITSLTSSTVAGNSLPQSIFYEYDPLGQHERTYAGTIGSAHTDTRYTHDSFGRLEMVSVVRRFNQVLTLPEVTRYGYDKVGNLDWTELPGQMAVDHVYDNLDRLIDEIYFVDTDNDHTFDGFDANGDDIYQPTEGEQPLARYTTIRDIQGRRIESSDRTYVVNATTKELFRWQYDSLGRVVKEEYAKSAAEPKNYTLWHDYDLASNRFRAEKFGDQPYLKQWTFDKNDRLIREIYDERSADPFRTSQSTYSYGPGNSGTRMTFKEEVKGEFVWRTRLDYDAAGKQASRTIEPLIVIAGIPFSGGPTDVTTYTYSIEGHRVSRTLSASRNIGTSHYLIDPMSPTGYAEVLLESRPDVDVGLSIYHYTLGHEIIGQTLRTSSNPIETTRLFISDALGSVRAHSEVSSIPVVNPLPAYDSFGNPLSIGATSADGSIFIGYAGQWRDLAGPETQGSVRESGQIYSRARYYQPGTGTFTTLDPYIGNPQSPLSLHKYLYAHADPINGKDPSGMFFSASIGGSFASIAGGLSSAVGSAAAGLAVLDRASTLADVVKLTSQLLLKGSLDVSIAGGLLVSAIPFGNILNKARIVTTAAGGKLIGFADELSDAFLELRRSANRAADASRVLGDLGALAVAKKLGMEPVEEFVTRYHGFDGLFKKGDTFIIPDAKGGSSRLEGIQMSQKWIKDNIERLSRDSGTKSLAAELDLARIEGRLQGMVVTTRYDAAGRVLDPEYVIKPFNKIGSLKF
ncbi:putative Ig domain-containing protein [bacterium]|nr:putative Ig domain-containing protein [bacterium]